MQTIINVATKVKIPVDVSDTDAVKLGALAALEPNQYEIGIQTAQIIARSLKGEDVGMMPVEFPASTELFLNEDTAQKIGMKLPNDIKAIATKIITKSK